MIELCAATGRLSEPEFVAEYARSGVLSPACGGALIPQQLPAWRLELIEQHATTAAASDRLWLNVQPEAPGYLTFTQCAMHWMRLAAALTIGAVNARCPGAFEEARRIVTDTTNLAGWDQKEIANLFRWQRVQLT